MVEVSRVLVVGGGLAGLAAAIALRDAGFAPELIEARRDWPTEGAAITMHANGVRALRRLGLGASARRRGGGPADLELSRRAGGPAL